MALWEDAKSRIERILAPADIRVGGDRPWDLRVLNRNLYARVLRGGSLGLGNAYVDGWWECESLDRFFFKILDARLDQKAGGGLEAAFMALRRGLFNLQTAARAFRVGERHYDLGNELYTAMLDSRMTYTCGYWKRANNLDSAQEAKLELVCSKLGLGPGMRVLDIGCGWGSFLKYAAEKYGVECVGVTVSREQADYVARSCQGLPVEARLQDYRSVEGRYDRVVSLGMFEHVGSANYSAYFETAHRCLRRNGVFLLHTITSADADNRPDPFIEKHIFPHSEVPAPADIALEAQDLFRMEDWHNLGPHYDPTLMAWFANFDRHWPDLAPRYGERFYRLWKYYLLSCAGAFRAQRNQVWQVVFSRQDNPSPWTLRP